LKVLVMGASGMMGHVVLRYLAQSPGYSVVGSVRSMHAGRLLPEKLRDQLVYETGIQTDSLVRLFGQVRPDVVVNCIGVVKQLTDADDPLAIIPTNALLPHRLLGVCKLAGARLIHLSTDCVFSGAKGMYREDDSADATDLYGRSKLLGEVLDPQAITLRMSIIGPELGSAHGLLGWFLAQRDGVRGFRHAIFSGLTTVELSHVLRDFVIPRPDLHGVLHIAADPISKYELLRLIATAYGVGVGIEPDDRLAVDRSLDAGLFRRLTGYIAPPWPEMIRSMREFG
jgi:dTDP-4-dehydrorhamnose reductase